MKNYIFRGKPISGAAAFSLVKDIKRVQELCPNPDDADIDVLMEIIKDFEQEWTKNIREEYPETD